MKWIVKYFRFYSEAGEPSGETKIIGYSDKSTIELFKILQEAYPDMLILKRVAAPGKDSIFSDRHYDINGDNISYSELFRSYVYFEESTLKEF